MPLKKIKSHVSDALKRSREKVKRLEQSLHGKQSKIEKLHQEVEQLKKENCAVERIEDEEKLVRESPGHSACLAPACR